MKRFLCELFIKNDLTWLREIMAKSGAQTAKTAEQAERSEVFKNLVAEANAK